MNQTTDTFLKRRFGSDIVESRVAEGFFLVAACIFPALISFLMAAMELTSWQCLVGMIVTASLGFQLLATSLLFRVLRLKK